MAKDVKDDDNRRAEGAQSPADLQTKILDSRIAFYGFAGGLAGALFGALGVIASAFLGFFHDNRELDIKMVDVGLAILAGEKGNPKSGEPSSVARQFAINAIRQYSGVTLTGPEWSRWYATGEPLPRTVLPAGLAFNADLDPLEVAGYYTAAFAGNGTSGCSITLSLNFLGNSGFSATSSGCESSPLANLEGWAVSGQTLYLHDKGNTSLAELIAKSDTFFGTLNSSPDSFVVLRRNLVNPFLGK